MIRPYGRYEKKNNKAILLQFNPYGGDEKNENEPHPQNVKNFLMVELNYQI